MENPWNAINNCEISFIITWSKYCSISVAAGETEFAIANTKLYVPVVNSSTQDNTKLLQELKSRIQTDN